jgi:hypothetical protein
MSSARLHATDPLGPAERDLVEVGFDVLLTYVRENAGDGAPNVVVEALGGVCVDNAAAVFLAR